jgi:hypothetical protein
MTNEQMTIAAIAILFILVLAFVFPIGAILVAVVGLVAFLLKKKPKDQS